MGLNPDDISYICKIGMRPMPLRFLTGRESLQTLKKYNFIQVVQHCTTKGYAGEKKVELTPEGKRVFDVIIACANASLT